MTDEAPGPLTAWLAWLESLPPEIARELVLSIMRLWPGHALRPALLTPDPVDGFVPRLRRLPTTALEEVGVAAMLAALTDLVLVERSDPASWARTEDLLEALDEAKSLVGFDEGPWSESLESFTERARARAPLRQRQWARAVEAWRPVRTGPLGPERLDAAHRAARIPAPG